MLKLRSATACLFAFCTLIASAVCSASASEHGLAPQQNGWEFSMTSYFWTLFITGEQTDGSTTEDVDTNIFEIIDEAEEFYGFMSYQELRTGKIGLFADLMWGKMNFNAAGVQSIGGVPGAPLIRANAAILAEADVWVDMAIVEPGVAFEIMNHSSGDSLKDPVASMQTAAVDVLGGVRYWYLRPDIDLNVTATINLPALGISRTAAGSVSAKKTIDWWDPYIGLRLRYQRGPGQEIVLRGDIGGFGAGSDFTWHINGAYNFDTSIFGHNATGMIGYRALYVDYSEGSGAQKLGFDWLWHGPTLGLKFTW